MCGFVNILEFLDAHLRVDLSGGQQGMSGHLLDVADVRAVLQHQRRHGVPEKLYSLLKIERLYK